MPRPVSDIAFTASVKAIQERLGSRKSYARMERGDGWLNEITPALAQFIAERDSFYLATAGAGGQPYIQHRGGPAGFLKVLDDRTLAFADFGGNQQYITLGNLVDNPKAFIFLMDYANRRRIKLWGTARVVEDDPQSLARLADPACTATPQRAIVFSVLAWDTNCSAHIPQLVPLAQVAPQIEHLQARIAQLEAALAQRAHE